jgi:RNA-binding protein
MKLTESQKRYLRGLAHPLKPCVTVGQAGVTAAVVRELGEALRHHELLKVRFRVGDRATRDAAVATLAQESSALVLGRTGNVAVMYRPNPEQPRISLPPPGA